MARERMVTRTIEESMYKCMCVNPTNSEVSHHWFPITGDRLTPDKALATIKKMYESDEQIIVVIEDSYTTEKLYGMLEIDFLRYARELDPDTRKMI